MRTRHLWHALTFETLLQTRHFTQLLNLETLSRTRHLTQLFRTQLFSLGLNSGTLLHCLGLRKRPPWDCAALLNKTTPLVGSASGGLCQSLR